MQWNLQNITLRPLEFDISINVQSEDLRFEVLL